TQVLSVQYTYESSTAIRWVASPATVSIRTPPVRVAAPSEVEPVVKYRLHVSAARNWAAEPTQRTSLPSWMKIPARAPLTAWRAVPSTRAIPFPRRPEHVGGLVKGAGSPVVLSMAK